MSARRSGFTIVEIMIVVAIIGLVMAVVLPNYVVNKAKANRTVCISNLRMIRDYLNLLVIQEVKTQGAAVTMGELVPTYLKKTPWCPDDNSHRGYTLTTTSADPVCPADPAHHTLP